MRISQTFICGLILCFGVSAQAADKQNHLTDDSFTMTAPEGFRWTKISEANIGGHAVSTYFATKEGAAGRIVVAVQRGAVVSDAVRIAKVKGHYEGIVEEATKLGLMRVTGSLPELKPPVPDRVVTPLTFKDAVGNTLALRAIVFFGKKNTYHFQVSDLTDDSVEVLVKTTESLKE